MAVIYKYIMIAFVGRLIFGIGSECLSVSANSLISIWFYHDDINIAIGLNLSVPRIGGALNSFFMPRIFLKYKSLTIALLFSTLVTFCFSFITGIILNVIDKIFRKSEVN